MNITNPFRLGARVFLLLACITIPAIAAPLQLVTTNHPSVSLPAAGNGDSWRPVITPDGRYVLFASRAENLALSSSNTPIPTLFPPKSNLYLRDRTTGNRILISVNLAGTGGGNGDSVPAALSTNGQYALFQSYASNLVPNDTNNATDVFLRDIVHGTTLLVSAATNGGCGNGPSDTPVMTTDGRYIAFSSDANNLAQDDTNNIRDIFVRDTQSGVTVPCSVDIWPVSYAGYNYSVNRSDFPQITPDGRYVSFVSTATNGFTRRIADLYVRDLVASNTFPVGTNVAASASRAISDDGHFVAYAPLSSGVIIHDQLKAIAGVNDVVCSNAVAALWLFNYLRTWDMTANGRFIAFVANTNVGSSGTTTVCMWDEETSTTTLVNAATNGTVPRNAVCDWPAVSSSGRYVAFLSTATNLTTNVVAPGFHLYVRDRQSGTTTLVDAGTNGVGTAKDFLSAPVLTPDGRFVAYDCTDGNLVPNDNNHAYDVFVRDLQAQTNELISVRKATLASKTPVVAMLGPVYSVSTDGRYIAYSAAADSLVAGCTNAYRNIFVRDLLYGTNVLVGVDTNGLAGADGMSTDPSISGDGRYVAFASGADNLVANDTNSAQDVFVRDLQTGITTLVSVNTNGTGQVSGASRSPTISADGRRVLFRSATVAPAPDANAFLRDLQTGTTYQLAGSSLPSFAVTMASMTSDGHYVAYWQGPGYLFVWDSLAARRVYTNGSSPTATCEISPDGNRIVYSTSAGFYVADRAANTTWMIGPPYFGSNLGLQFSGDSRLLVYSTAAALDPLDTNGVADVYLYDFQTRSNFLVSRSLDPSAAANGRSDSPVISTDGRFVAYRSAADNIVAGDTNGAPDIFLYDRQTGVTTLLSASAVTGGSGNNRSLAPMFSGDGRTVVFQSWASDLVAHDYNQGSDLFALKIGTTNPVSVFAGQVVFVPASGQSPTLNWPAVSGKSYQVQFKDNLGDAVWQPLTGNVWVVGDQGYATDLLPGFTQRFYRVAAF